MDTLTDMMDLILGCSLVAVVVLPCLFASHFGRAHRHTNKTA